ncbi:hypothetical protein CONCODRAFT_76729 [Conidiobolus coronatus NRRL 28638]|uniref:Elongation factor P n=1 Tax=Conidiobolus coronatus (strain ATCC 28846 / CBS 209.66 / NRRL 28638) TaxID=796925 RepID=A0A137PI54_CONC2|nr:hypothetical protein CONCODRAFT_76729 [Conidiobolus coronatus NRRL 28638]|eukprot:KXN74655.1 hypothetical protein CONCODRAFT_76729 [Conidiobolus coronatus NRRL 28638]
MLINNIKAISKIPSVQRYSLFFNRGYKVGVNSVKEGNIIEHKGKNWLVLNKDHSVMGRGSATIKLEIKDLSSDYKIVERFKPKDDLEIVEQRTSTYQYLYHDADEIHLLHPETSDQISVQLSALVGGEKAINFLQEEMSLVVSILEDGNPVSAKLPSSGIYEVESVTMKAKQASRGVMKVPGFLKGGMQVMVPEFVQSGDKVQIDLNTFEYMGRA